MAQTRILLPRETEKQRLLENMGYRWCITHNRWEKSMIDSQVEKLIEKKYIQFSLGDAF